MPDFTLGWGNYLHITQTSAMKNEPHVESFAHDSHEDDGMISLADALAQADLEAELDEEL